MSDKLQIINIQINSLNKLSIIYYPIEVIEN